MQARDSLIIEGVPVQLGLHAHDAMLLFRTASAAQEGSKILITSPRRVGNATLPVVVATLHLEDGVVAGACRNWPPTSTTESELARVLFGATTSILNGEPIALATTSTAVERTAEQTVERIEMLVGNRRLVLTRTQVFDSMFPKEPYVELEECLMTPGMPLGSPSE